jgi:hypothetical protein
LTQTWNFSNLEKEVPPLAEYESIVVHRVVQYSPRDVHCDVGIGRESSEEGLET